MESITKEVFEVAEIELSYKSKVKPSLRPKVGTSHDAANILRQYWEDTKMELVEQFYILVLNRANKVLGFYKVSSGTVAGCYVDAKSVFVPALKANACAVILAHNHPSGSTSPSQADIDVTKKLAAGGKLLDINVLDHVILTTESHYSFADEGLI